MIGKTNSKQVMESAMEFVNVQLSTNQSSHQDILGAKVIVSYGTYTNEYAWNGDDVTFTVPAQVGYTVSFGEIEGYRKPSSVTFSAVDDNARTIEAVYETEIVSVDLSATDGSSLDGAVDTINGKSQTWKGTTLTQKVAYGTVYSVVAGALSGYVTPSAQTNITANSPTRSLSFSYVASSLTVNILSNQDTDAAIASVKATVSYGSTSVEVSSGQAVNIPTGSSVTISFPEVEGYKKPEDITFIHNGGVVTKSGTYQCELLTVNVSADSGSVSGFEVTISKQETVGISTKYTRLEYIESTGTQYIDTGFKANNNTRVVMDLQANSISGNAWAFGGRDSTSSNAMAVFYYYSSSKLWNADYVGSSNRQSFSGVGATDRIAIDFNKNSCSINGVLNTFTAASFQSSSSIALLAVNTAGTVTGYINAKLYSCKIYDNGALVRDYIPALRSDGIAGLYDSVNDTFYASNGTGNFIAGSKQEETIAVQTTVTGSYKIPFDTSYTVQASKVNGYTTPSSITRIASANSYVVSQEYAIVTTRDLSLMDIYGNTISRTTANCYVVKEAGTYMFPLVYGNALKNGSINTEAYTNNNSADTHDFVAHDGTIISTPYIETLVGDVASAQLSISDTDNIFTDISIIEGSPCRYVQFSVSSIPVTGANGVISIKNSSGVIMWSWHIWVWADDLSVVEITNSTNVKYNILPVNLGSKWDDSAKTKIKNWFYQFGRPTPLLCPSAYNSTSNHASYGALGFTASSYVSYLYHAIQNPTIFYQGNSDSNNNWFNSIKIHNLWDAANALSGVSDNDVVKTIYDPCPVGFHIPNGNTFTGFSTSNVVGSFNYGWKFKRYSGDTVGVFFPASGGRVEGTLAGVVGTYGCILLSATYGSRNKVYHLSFTSGYVEPHYYLSSAAYGGSVRPVQE